MIKRRIVFSIALILFTTLLSAQDDRTITIGNIEAKSGEKVSGSLIVEKGIDEGTIIPVTIINGAKSGPVLTLVAGIHGTEYVPIITLQQLLNEINPNELSGTVILVHIANIPSYNKRLAYYNPVDNKNLNRVFPGNEDGTISERIAFTITNEIIKRSDYYIDLHGGEADQSLVNFIYFDYGCTDNDLCKKSSIMAHAMGINYLIPEKNNSVHDSVKYAWSDLIAFRNGVPAIAVDIGDRGKVDLEEIKIAKQGIINVMRTINMLDGKAFKNEQAIYLIDENFISSNHNGIFYSVVEKEQYISKGTLLGYTTDYWGNVLEEYFSPITGMVVIANSIPTINRNDLVFKIARVTDKLEE